MPGWTSVGRRSTSGQAASKYGKPVDDESSLTKVGFFYQSGVFLDAKMEPGILDVHVDRDLKTDHPQRIDGAIAFFIGLITVIILVVTNPSIGLVTDEPNYIAAIESHAEWLYMLVVSPARAFTPTAISTFLSVTAEHPPMLKFWAGAFWLVGRHFLESLTAYRLGAILLSGLIVALLYTIVSREFGRLAGVFSGAALMTTPRFFFHAHLATLDVPVSFGIFAVTCLFWLTVERENWWWGILMGFSWGLAEGIKLNATFLPVGLVLWSLVFHRKRYVFLRFLLMGVVAVVTFFVGWPWLYFDTWPRLLNYINFHLHHYGIGVWYLGRFYSSPPWHYVFVILWAVLPLTIILLIGAGIARTKKGGKGSRLIWLLVLGVFGSILPFVFGKTLAYDGERLFMPVFPFLAALAGIGFGWLTEWLRHQIQRKMKSRLLVQSACISLGVALLTPQVVTMSQLYPHLLSYYSESIGGMRGASKLGLETTYWFEALHAAVAYLNTHAEAGDIIWVEDSDVLQYAQILGRLRSDVNILPTLEPVDLFEEDGMAAFLKMDWYIYVYRQSKFGVMGAENYPAWQILKDQIPVYTLQFQDVPIMSIYGPLK